MRPIPMHRAASLAATLVGLAWLAAAALDTATARAADTQAPYPLDGIGRVLAPGEPLPCARAGLAVHRGDRMRYSRPARVHPAFVPRLRALEGLAEALAREVYGRAPIRLVHLGTHNCRAMRRYPDWVSEHALGNAIDLAGFDFGPAARRSDLPAGVPAALRRPFSVRLDRDWNGKTGKRGLHARFLHELARRLIARPDLFSVVLGPAWPGHHNHLHLDRAPYRVVEVFR